jgi:hypothetical protein
VIRLLWWYAKQDFPAQQEFLPPVVSRSNRGFRLHQERFHPTLHKVSNNGCHIQAQLQEFKGRTHAKSPNPKGFHYHDLQELKELFKCGN